MVYKRIISHFAKKLKKSEVPKPQHWNYPIEENLISANARNVLAGLQKAGFEAYLVGGGVRDLLVGKLPKDFDIVTNASPDQIRRIFRNSRIIGRRFQIVHVFYSREIIEVSTFRAQIVEPVMAIGKNRPQENVFGTIEEDAWRRDFTINALYYNLQQKLVIDYTGGMQDLKKNMIRIIGDPTQRFHEDPVRLLRAIRLSAKLQFSIHEETEKQLRDLPDTLQHVAKSRLFDEVLKLFFTGHAQYTYEKLQTYNYFSAIFPSTAQALSNPKFYLDRSLIELAMQETDRRYHDQDSLNPGFLFAVLLWPAIQKKMRQNSHQKFHFALHHAIDEVLKSQAGVLVIPNRLTAMMRAIWLLQYNLINPRKRRIYRTFFHRYFRAAFDFLEMRVKVGEPHQEAFDWWRKFRESQTAEREQMLEELVSKKPKKNTEGDQWQEPT